MLQNAALSRAGKPPTRDDVTIVLATNFKFEANAPRLECSRDEYDIRPR